MIKIARKVARDANFVHIVERGLRWTSTFAVNKDLGFWARTSIGFVIDKHSLWASNTLSLHFIIKRCLIETIHTSFTCIQGQSFWANTLLGIGIFDHLGTWRAVKALIILSIKVSVTLNAFIVFRVVDRSCIWASAIP